MALSSEAIVFEVSEVPSEVEDAAIPILQPYSSGRARGLSLSLYHPTEGGALEPRLTAPDELEARLAHGTRLTVPIVLGVDADPYPADELGHRLTRRCLEVCLRHHVPVVLLTRSAIVERDLDLLRRLAMGPGVSVAVGITMFDGDRARAFEPNAPSPARRLETISTLSKAQIPTVLSIAPAIWGLTDTDLVRLLSAAAEAGARATYYRRLQLDGEAADRLVAYVKRVVPDRARRVASGLRWSMGPHAAEDAMRQIVEYTAASVGVELLTDAPWNLDDGTPRPAPPPRHGEQLALFDAAPDAEEESAPSLPLM